MTFSFVLLIPFYMAANTAGEGALLLMVCFNLLVMGLGYRALWRKWPEFVADVTGAKPQAESDPHLKRSRIPNIPRDD